MIETTLAQAASMVSDPIAGSFHDTTRSARIFDIDHLRSKMTAPSEKRRSERSRRAILDAAGKLLTERGYTAITIDGIAAEAKVGKTTIYRWWPTKASIFMELYAELATQVSPVADTGSLFQDLSLLLRGAFKLYRETAAGLALAGIVAEAQSNAMVSRVVRNDFAPSRRQIILTILERAVKRGEIPKGVDIDIVSEVVAGASWYCVLVGSGQLTDRHAIRLTETILAGLLPRDAARRAPVRLAKRKTTKLETAAAD